MSKSILTFILMAAITPIFAQSGTVNLTITGIENTNGTVVIGVFNSKSTFPRLGKEVKKADIKPKKAGSLTYTFKDLPAGTYAIAVLHDENDNKTLDNFLGKPKEHHGFSNNVKGSILGPPSFDSASFKVTAGKVVELTIDIELE